MAAYTWGRLDRPGCEVTEYLMDWEGFWALATSCSEVSVTPQDAAEVIEVAAQLQPQVGEFWVVETLDGRQVGRLEEASETQTLWAMSGSRMVAGATPIRKVEL